MTAEYVDEAVHRLAESPREGESVLVAIGVTGDRTTVREHIDSLGGEVRKTLPYDTLRVEVPETGLEDLCSMPGLESVEMEREIRTHSSGN